MLTDSLLRSRPPEARGAPGVYLIADAPSLTLAAEPMDVAAFVGVAPRGPAWEPLDDTTLAEAGVTRARSVAVPVDSWDDYVERFGTFEAPSLLPHAVASFFSQGGRRAWVVRVVHDEVAFESGLPVPLGCACLSLAVGTTVLVLRARNEGAWGNRLQVTLSYSTQPLIVASSGPAELVLDPGSRVPAASLLRLQSTDGALVFRSVTNVRWRGRTDRAGRDLVASLDLPLGFALRRAELVEAVVTVVDRDPARLRQETFDRLGLQLGHPRWLGDVLHQESRLVDVAASPPALVLTDTRLSPVAAEPDEESPGGTDRWHLVTPSDVFGNLLEGDASGTEGLDALLAAPEVATIVVADLYSPADLPVTDAVELPGVGAGPAFAPCLASAPARHPAPPALPLTGLHLDPLVANDLETIIGLQQDVVSVSERLGCVTLLDVPPGLRQRDVLRWRSRFDSSYAAGYHPWLRVPASDPAGALIALNPSAVAAGIIARCERREGVPRGPANELASGVVDVTDRVDDDRHGDLHQRGIDVFRAGPNGVWLTGARTLSTEQQWRQLTVRRLLLLVERAVLHQLQWTVFEPNDAMLRAGLKRSLDQLLGRLFAQGAFAGATPSQSWFVHVAEGGDIAFEADQGQVVVEVGVAPSEPTEFIVVRLRVDAAGAVESSLRMGTGVLGNG